MAKTSLEKIPNKIAIENRSPENSYFIELLNREDDIN